MMIPAVRLMRGRLKEAAGVLAGNERWKRQGRLDQAGAKVDHVVDKLADTAKKTLRGSK